MDELRMKKAIITGGSGGPGQALVRKLISENVEVLLLIRKSSGRAKYFPESNLISYAECDLDQMKDYAPNSRDYDVFFHLGWDYTHPKTRNDPYYQYKNIATTLDAVDLAYRSGCKAFIGCGSQAEYGRFEGKLTPHTPCNPQIAYGMAKLCANHMSKLACEEKGIKFNWLRVLSVYGPVDNPYNVFSDTVLRLLSGKKPNYTKGEQIWDLLYTGDLAEAFYAVAQKGKDGAVYTVGCGTEQTLRSEIEVFIRQLAPEYEPEFGALPYPEGQIMYLLADNTDITNDTGWKPCTGLEEGAKKTISFWKYIHDLYAENIYQEYFRAGQIVRWEDK